ncbi:hypothetical protein FQN60_008744 [Etheostoma spectabile]|uniref:Uncharacterized protein n=1 Tax=Etheostoma spectabile TaxID=54343 RepID=A0A5J5CJK8_9PERO|nr:hypothetical protein FQN60_008744 [Etheostoma spectabile]
MDMPNSSIQIREFFSLRTIYPKKPFGGNEKDLLHHGKECQVLIFWSTFREEPNRNIYHPHKMIVQPRMVQQPSIHEVLKCMEKV